MNKQIINKNLTSYFFYLKFCSLRFSYTDFIHVLYDMILSGVSSHLRIGNCPFNGLSMVSRRNITTDYFLVVKIIRNTIRD